jgi:putative hydrolase of the HAD superfamily
MDAGGEKIRAVLFDVYGTLFCSAAGDIGVDGGPGEGLDALAAAYVPPFTGKELRAYFHRRVLALHRELAPRRDYPEVRVDEIWDGFLRSAGQGETRPPIGGRELALRYELAVNPVYPMPGALETIRALGEAGMILGLISNAQFFTPLLFTAFFGASPAGLGFDPALLVYSIERGEAKPSPGLFAAAVRELARRGIGPEQCLYVGNDMLNDAAGAARAGFSAVLFAGDGRSLRLREGDRRVRGIRPDAVIRGLGELLPLCGLYNRDK